MKFSRDALDSCESVRRRQIFIVTGLHNLFRGVTTLICRSGTRLTV